MLSKKIIVVSFLFFVAIGFSQEKKTMNASMISTATYMRAVGPLAGKKLIPEEPREGEINPRKTDANKIVPGKGFPRGIDPLLAQQKSNQSMRAGKAPSLTFEANSSSRSPTDPTGAIGPNHYVSAKNSAFAIHDRSGNELVASSSLSNIFAGETLGDPIVFYDQFADRFVITQFSDTPDGFLVAVCQGPDPVNDGWFTYRFNTDSFPDYTKFSIWSDGYYVTANKDQNSVDTSEVVFVIEREKMLLGEEDVKMVGFPLPGARTGGFYSPAAFNALGNTLPPDGDARIIYFQDDEWAGVDQDALKFWKIDVNWASPSSSTIAEAEEITVTPFDSTFDGGSFSNIPQPGGGASDIDVLQGAVMFASNYRRFCSYNSVLINFAVDIDAVADNISAIRWYELRQNGDGQPWTVYQEGTYMSPDGKSAWCGSMAMDIFGNIGMGYTTMGTTANGATVNSFASIRYTGRLASDPLGTMTIAEQTIAVGTGDQVNGGNRYGDYAQLTVDPTDDQTFWHIAEYYENGGFNARNIVGVFKVAEVVTTDVGVVSIDAPVKEASFAADETITVTIKNFGTTAQSNISVDYSVNGGTPITELFAGPLNPGQTTSFSFATKADLSVDETYTIMAETNLAGDATPENDCSIKKVTNLPPKDVGVTELVSPTSESGVAIAPERVTITIFNYGNTPQSNIPVFYILDNEGRVDEVFTGTLGAQQSVNYTFDAEVDITGIGNFGFQVGTALPDDQDVANNAILRTVERKFCRPTSDCAQFNDGITFFELSNVTNSSINCSTGYNDFSENLTINLNRSIGAFVLTVQSGFADNEESERLSLWIDFNDNTVFEESELLLNNIVIEQKNRDQDIVLSLPGDAALGKHLLRVRAGDTGTNNGADLNDPCGSMDFGTTHDYTVDIGENKSIENEVLVVAHPDDQFLITKEDAGLETELRVYVYNILGQIIASNLVKKDANDRFAYTIDMSYARSGIYFVRFGEKKKEYAAKFYVQ
ncbi:GEVED domain-containing protein [Aquimarina sediminis]|uniref:GEVED domain-containing protein n=1 Tax=Aquimarina sediminis TaxID=2070536 RepID=UPI000CA06B16|nr:GEVED domain-containing protein [Aquimarina sediminis]